MFYCHEIPPPKKGFDWLSPVPSQLQAAQLWEKIRNDKSEKDEEHEKFMLLGMK